MFAIAIILKVVNESTFVEMLDAKDLHLRKT